MNDMLHTLRAAGWSVAVHNDYRLNGEARTFWLFTHPSGVWAKGEGQTDAEALAKVVSQTVDRLASVGAAPTAEAMVPVLSIIAAMDRADGDWGVNLIRLVDGVRTWEARVGEQRQEFDDNDKAYAWVADFRKEAKARAVLALSACLTSSGQGERSG